MGRPAALSVAPGTLLLERLGDAVGFHGRVGVEDGAHSLAGTPPGGKIKGVGQDQATLHLSCEGGGRK